MRAEVRADAVHRAAVGLVDAGAGARSKRPAGVSRLDVEYAASIDGGYASSIDQRTAGEAKGTHYIRNVFKPEQVMHQLPTK